MNPAARAALLDRIREFDWYQKIPLGDGIFTPGEDDFTQTKLPHLQLPTDLTGRAVLDIGCSEGFFAFEAERRGAARVLGVDTAPGLAEKFSLLTGALDSMVEFREMAIYDIGPESTGCFDLVIFLSVFQHLRHPYLALDRISTVTDDLAIMEVPVAVANADDEAFQRDAYSLVRRSPKGHRILMPNEAMLADMILDAGFKKFERLIRHRPREISGYGGQFRQERLIFKAHKSG
jgi:tRNA (mo5U34)-methyltransferase